MKSLFVFSLISLISFGALAQGKSDSLKTMSLDPVVVTGQFEPQSLSKSVYQVRTISGEAIQQRSATNVQSVLSTELGIRFSTDATLGTSEITLMGMDGQSVKILLDGVPLVDRNGTRESLNQIDVNSIKRIEIVEGPMSVSYGTDALAGVINIITKKGGDNNDGLTVSGRVLEETANTEYSPFANKGVHNENVHVDWQRSTWNAGGGVTRINFGGWQGSKTGRDQQWDGKDQWLGTGSFGYTNDAFNAWYRLNYANETIHSLGDLAGNEAVDQDYISNRYTHQAQANWRASERFSVNAVGSFQNYSRRTLTTNYNAATGNRTLNIDLAGGQAKAEFTSTTFRGTTLFKVSEKISLQSGVDINLNKGFGDRIDGTHQINDYALFASTEITPTSKISIRPGLRFLYNSAYKAPPVIPTINTKFDLSDQLALRLSYAYGFRAPTLRDLYFLFVDASHNIIGNPDLKAEHSNSFTGSLTWHIPSASELKITPVLGGYFNDFSNMISYVASAQNAAITTTQNILKNRTGGVTLNSMITWKALKATVGVAYIGAYNQYASDDSSLPYITYTPELNSTVMYAFTSGTSLNAYYKYTGVRPYYTEITDPATSTQKVALAKMSAFQFLDVTASQKITKWLNLNAGAKNILNVTNIQSTAGASGSAHSTSGPVPMSYGRSYFLGMTFKLTQ